ncbi:ribonuclease R [Acidaminobacter sp. JC074]|uniref:ribonuclease R n=1 Tax=Acidaminobacter sp. JC074 TaxID=2530199 RepID=UPI001F0EBB9D|nr:ribonuclease R [Acidaminobacter sp. JC074]MCH4889118.1 ribonuclease R [Acidaminobacter sp. JC074]
MVTKIEILKVLREDVTKPIFDFDLFKLMELDKKDSDEFLEMLDELEAEGKVLKTKKDKYGIPERFGLVSGKVQVTKKGFAFLLSEEAGVSDTFIPAAELNTAMNGDTVLVKLTKQPEDNRRGEGKVERVIKRAYDTIVGTFEASKDYGFVVADDKKMGRDFYIGKKDTKGAESGDKVVVKIIKYSEQNRNPEGKIIDILGKAGTHEAEIQSIIKMHGLPEAFPKKVLRQADRIDTSISQEEIDRRKDFRNDLVVTIDGADAKDLDDAISISKLDNGHYELGVHIADVTHYVQERSKLDVEALKRGTSVYLVDRVIPMLPKVLSNGICSLNPHEDRLTMSIVMEINEHGKVINQQIYESIINSNERLTYTDVSDILEDNLEGKDLSKYDYLNETFIYMRDLAAILRKSREMRGMIDFNFPEAKVVTDEEGLVTDIVIRESRVSNKIIEEFMLKANETIAEYMYWLELPFVYRVHENPTEEKIAEFNKLIHNFGYTIKGNLEEIHPREIQKLLNQVEGKKEEALINKMMLRSLKQAKYSPFNDGHFGLAAQYYCHFTSPIRRYPDLQIHRIIKESLNGTIDKGRTDELDVIVANAAEQASKQERIAEKAERDTVDLKMAEYMSNYVGEEYDGIISSLTSFGIFVQLENTIEGLVRMVDLVDDYYIFDEANMLYIGEHTRKTYHIGDELRIRVENVSIKDREIDFTILEKKE